MSATTMRVPAAFSQVRVEMRLLWRGSVLPVCLVIFALLAVANVVNTANSVRADYALVQHTRAEYAANGMDFAADLRKPAKVTTRGGEQSISNLARYDYDTMADAVVSISPGSSAAEAMKYFAFLLFPLAFFLIGLWLATGQCRYQLEKVTLVRVGTTGTVAARQLTLLAVAVIVVATVVTVDVVARAVATSVLSSQLPLTAFAPLSPAPSSSALAESGVVLLVVLFFGGAGLAVGAIAGVFAIPGNSVPDLGLHRAISWAARSTKLVRCPRALGLQLLIRVSAGTGHPARVADRPRLRSRGHGVPSRSRLPWHQDEEPPRNLVATPRRGWRACVVLETRAFVTQMFRTRPGAPSS